MNGIRRGGLEGRNELETGCKMATLELLGCRIKELLGCRMKELVGCGIKLLLSCGIRELLSCGIKELLSCGIRKLDGCRMKELLGSKMKKLVNGSKTELSSPGIELTGVEAKGVGISMLERMVKVGEGVGVDVMTT